MTIRAIDPRDGTVVAEYESHDEAAVDRRLDRARDAFGRWRREPTEVRLEVLAGWAAALRRRKTELAETMAREMGKPIAQGEAEIEKCARACDYYVEHAGRLLAPRDVPTEAAVSRVVFAPLGVVLAVMPWNFPFWQVVRCAAPTLAAGNTVVLKHASNVPGCALALEELAREAGFAEGCFTTLLIPAAQVARLIEDSRVAAVSLTGSTEAGRAVAACAGRALKKTVLELGGSDPYVVLADADLAPAARACVQGRLINGGQSCIAAKRWIVVDAVREEFQELVVRGMAAAVVGDPMDRATEVGPMARVDLRDELHDQVLRSVAQGAEPVLGGEIPERPGAWYPPTVLAGVRPGMAAHDEELFGPVGAIVSARDEREALRLANATRFGLGAAIFTSDRQRGLALAQTEMEAGSCFVNDFVRSDPRLPFGGVKESGYGRELGEQGIYEFVNVKTVQVAAAGP